jgi:hypothetical protein
MPDNRKLSQDPVFNNLLPRDKVVVLRSPLDELEPAKRNGTASLDTLAAALVGRLLANHLTLLLPQAQALPASDPPGVVANALYGITGDWNDVDTDSTVYVHGVTPTAYHRLGVVYDEQGVAQLVEVDVVAGTYEGLAPNKADLDPDTGRLKEGQQTPATGGIAYESGKGYVRDDGLKFDFQVDKDKRVNPNTGVLEDMPGWNTYNTTAPSNARLRSNLPLLYACYNALYSAKYLAPWTAGAQSIESNSPPGSAEGCAFLVSVEAQDAAKLFIYPYGINADLPARVSALEALGGRLRGPWVAKTAYRQYDMVLQNGLQYANANHTSGTTFDATRWTSIGAGGTGGPITSVGAGFDATGGVLNHALDNTTFEGSTGSAANGLGGYTPPDTQQYRFAPITTIAVDKGACWDSSRNVYRAKVSGEYLVNVSYQPGYPSNAAIGNDFYAGPAIGSPAASPKGMWKQVSRSTRGGINITVFLHLNAGDELGMAERQLGSGDSNNTTGYEGTFPAVLGLTISLRKPDRL